MYANSTVADTTGTSQKNHQGEHTELAHRHTRIGSDSSSNSDARGAWTREFVDCGPLEPRLGHAGSR